MPKSARHASDDGGEQHEDAAHEQELVEAHISYEPALDHYFACQLASHMRLAS